MEITLKTEDEKLIFTFDSTRWSLVKAYDTLKDVNAFSDSKVDFIGVLDENKVFLIEVKNLRNRPPNASDGIIKKLQVDEDSKYDSKNQPIIKEMLDCVKDSLLFMTLHQRYETVESDLWIKLQSFLTNKEVKIVIILCLEMDNEYLPKIDSQKLKVIRNTIEKRLKAVFSRITDQVLLIDSQSNSPFFKIKYQT